MARFYPFIRRTLRFGARLFLFACGVWIVLAVLFSFLPVHYSGVMAERQLSAWLSGDFGYAARQTWVEEEEIAPVVFLAVLAAEDQRFPDHWGLDTGAIFSVLGGGGSLSRIRGASTITQQTAKNLFLWSGRSWIRKGLEAGMSLGLEMLWSKRRILTVYLNIIEFGNGVFGVEQAAQTYFKKPASNLTRNEAALMAAVLPNPHIYRLDAPSNYVKQRQAWILRQMNQLGGTAFLDRL